MKIISKLEEFPYTELGVFKVEGWARGKGGLLLYREGRWCKLLRSLHLETSTVQPCGRDELTNLLLNGSELQLLLPAVNIEYAVANTVPCNDEVISSPEKDVAGAELCG